MIPLEAAGVVSDEEEAEEIEEEEEKAIAKLIDEGFTRDEAEQMIGNTDGDFDA